MVADLGNRPASAVDQIDEKLAGLGFSNDTINGNINDGPILSPIPSKRDSSRM